MTELGDYEVHLDGEVTSDHLFGLVCQFKSISAMEADRKLKAGFENIRYWAEELNKKGIVDVEPSPTGDFHIKITPEGEKKFEELRKLWTHESEPEKAIKTKRLKSLKYSRPSRLKRLNDRISIAFRNNPLFYTSLLVSFYFIFKFYRSPNEHAMMFLLGALFLSVAFYVYQRKYKHTLPSKIAAHMREWWGKEMAANQMIILFPIVIICLIYSLGMVFMRPESRSLYLLLTVFFTATLEVLHFQKKRLSIVLKFYLGVLLIASGIILILGMTSPTEVFFGERKYFLDLAVGFAILIFANAKDKEFHLSLILERKTTPKNSL
jgi:hypothetical protein